MNSRIYADYAAAAPLDPVVKQNMIETMDLYANPSSIHQPGHQVAQIIDDLAARAARLLGVKPSGIVFTSGATESNNLVIGNQSALALATDHKSITAQPGVQTIAVQPSGHVDLADLANKVNSDTQIVSIAHVNSETGVIQPISEIDQALNRINPKVNLHIDASQSHFVPINIAKLGASSITISAGKLFGPKGAGIYAFATGHNPTAQMHGGGQQGGLRPGTPSLSQIIGTVTALELSRDKQKVRRAICAQHKQKVLDMIADSGIEYQVVGSAKHGSDHILNLILPGIESERLVLELDAIGVAASSGSACTAGSSGGSYVLEAMGYDKILAGQTLRLSFAHLMTDAEAKQIAQAMINCVNRIKERGF